VDTRVAQGADRPDQVGRHASLTWPARHRSAQLASHHPTAASAAVSRVRKHGSGLSRSDLEVSDGTTTCSAARGEDPLTSAGDLGGRDDHGGGRSQGEGLRAVDVELEAAVLGIGPPRQHRQGLAQGSICRPVPTNPGAIQAVSHIRIWGVAPMPSRQLDAAVEPDVVAEVRVVVSRGWGTGSCRGSAGTCAASLRATQ
jgi:hypothetical protein